MNNYLEKNDQKLSEKLLKQGYIIFKPKNFNYLKNLRNIMANEVQKTCKLDKKLLKNPDYFLNNFHKYIKKENLNKHRLEILKRINSSKDFKRNYFYSAKEMLYSIIGNELVMQTRINLSIQTPNDSSSLLPVHSDIWSGDSPFEMVVWIPLVNCYSSKTMYILQPEKYKKIYKNFSKFTGNSSAEFFGKIKKMVKWININFGEVMIFNQALPHGNIVNKEKETRWSMNCRFKSIFSPYGDKKIGEFFEPITLRAASEIGMKYELPKIK